MTAAEIKKKHLSISHVWGGYSVFFKCDNQKFRIAPEWGSKEGAAWQSDMLAIALERMIQEATK